VAGDPNWCAVDPAAVPAPGVEGPAVGRMLQHGHPQGSVWRPAECDVSIRPGWFYHPAQDAAIRDVDNFVELYFTSVGRNAKLLLNVPPTPDGVIHAVDAARLLGFRNRLDRMFGNPLSLRQLEFRPPSAAGARVEWELRRPASPRIARLSEDITRGQRVASYHLEGSQGGRWQTLTRGTTIGYAKLDRLPDGPVFRRIRLVIDEWVATPEPVAIQLFDQS